MTEADTGAPADTGATAKETEQTLADNLLEDFGAAEKKAEVKTEEKTEEKTDDKAKEEKQHTTVSHAALHEERERRKETSRQLAEEKKRNDTLSERQQKIFETLAARGQADEPEYVDPITRVETEVKSLKTTLDEAKKAADDDKRKFDEESTLVNRYKGSLEAFRRDVPDILDARQYLINSRAAELQALGYDQAEIEQAIKDEEKNIVSRAYLSEKNPGELILQAAKTRGYSGKKEENGSAADSKAETKIQQMDKGLKASKTLGSGGTSPRTSNDLDAVSATELADMTDEEFKAFFTKIERAAKKSA